MVEVVKYPDPVLRKQTIPVDFEEMSDLEIGSMYSAMLTALVDNHGVGIAAPQVGIDRNAAIIQDREGKFIPVANLDISQRSGPYYAIEGCLSSPNKKRKVRRFSSVTVYYQDLFTGEKHKIRLTGMPAQVAQHEYDHLIGRTIEEYGTKVD